MHPLTNDEALAARFVDMAPRALWWVYCACAVAWAADFISSTWFEKRTLDVQLVVAQTQSKCEPVRIEED